jgi:hypothetical protein
MFFMFLALRLFFCGSPGCTMNGESYEKKVVTCLILFVGRGVVS